MRIPRRAMVVTTLVAVAVALSGCARWISFFPPRPSDTPSATPDPTMTAPPTPTPTPSMHLVWSDEFNGASLDRTKWSALNNSTFGDGNNELACLRDRPSNVDVTGGVLTLSAERETTPVVCGSHDSRFPSGRTYTSGFVETRGKASFEYGRFEIRARLPTVPGHSAGLWPAFWLRPASGNLGELDILEVTGSNVPGSPDPNTIAQTIHYDYSHKHPQQRFTVVGDDLSGRFHTYAVDWEPGSIRWYVDGVLTAVRDRASTPWIDEAFSGKFYLRLNLAVGGNGVGEPGAATALPARFDVDWVRVYQR